MGWLVTRELFRLPSKFRAVSAILAVMAFAVTELGRHVVRPYVRATGLDDLGITNSIGNLGGIIVQIFFSFAIINPTPPQSYRLTAFFSAGYIAYEFLQPPLPRGTFDWNDVLGTLIGGSVSMLLTWLLWRVVPEEGRGISGEGPRERGPEG
jgi:hypothetical protein